MQDPGRLWLKVACSTLGAGPSTLTWASLSHLPIPERGGPQNSIQQQTGDALRPCGDNSR
jgi:hypothetical protein